MLPKLKILGLTLVAMIAVSGPGGASGASASAFRCEVAQCIITGTNTPSEGNHVISFPGSQMVCQDAQWKGTAKESFEATWILNPTYGGCTLFGEAATTETKGCNFVISATTNLTGHLPVSVTCTSGKKINSAAEGCTVSIDEQSTVEGVKATNLGSGANRDVTLDATFKVHYLKNSGALCFLIGPPPGTYTGNTTVQCFKDDKVTGNIDESAAYDEGVQVGCWWEA